MRRIGNILQTVAAPPLITHITDNRFTHLRNDFLYDQVRYPTKRKEKVGWMGEEKKIVQLI